MRKVRRAGNFHDAGSGKENYPQEGIFRGSLRGWRTVARSRTNGEHSTDAVHSLLSTLVDATISWRKTQ
jgi:hypothetical protein